MPLPKNLVTATNLLSTAASRTVKGPYELHKIADTLCTAPNTSHLRRWIIFQTMDWSKVPRLQRLPSDPLPSKQELTTVAVGQYDILSAMLIALRARKQGVYLNSPSPFSFRMVMAVEHPEHHCVAWINAETGEIEKTKPWLRHVDAQEQEKVTTTKP